MKISRALIVLTILALLLSGCGGAAQPTATAGQADTTATTVQESAAEPTATVAEEATVEEPTAEDTAATDTATEDTVGDEELNIDTVSSLSTFDSYRTEWTMTYEYTDSGEQTTMQVVNEFVRDPAAQRMAITTESTADESSNGTLEMITVDGATYMNTGSGWISMQSSDTEAQESGWWWSDPDNVFGNEEGEYVGAETVNGMQTKHYHYTYNEGAYAFGLSSLKSGEADVWVSDEYDVYVKYVVNWLGTDEEKGDVNFSMEATVSDINQPITITPPEGVEKPSLAEDLPMLDGATNVTIMGGITSYTVSMSVDDAYSAVKSFMDSNGWSVDSDMGATMTSFTKGDRTATIMVSEGDSEGTTSVTIMSGE